MPLLISFAKSVLFTDLISGYLFLYIRDTRRSGSFRWHMHSKGSRVLQPNVEACSISPSEVRASCVPSFSQR